MKHYSLSEVDALSRKAARGAGYSWGLAEDVGRSVRWLTAYGFAGMESLAALLQRIEGRIDAFKPMQIRGVWSSNAGFLCPIFCGAIINDRAELLTQNQTHQLSHVMHPILALPQAARITETHAVTVHFCMNDITVGCTKDGLSITESESLRLDEAQVTCLAADVITPNLFPLAKGRPVSQDAIEILHYFAHKTYVPATETSRLAGAGAGLTDND